MSKPFIGTIKKSHADDISNPSENPAFSSVLQTHLSRRNLLQSTAALGAAAALPSLGLFGAPVAQAHTLSRASQLGFQSVPFSTRDEVVVPKGYTARAFYKWGDPVGIIGNMPAFRVDGSNSAAEQAVQAGMHHDGMAFFPLPLGSANTEHGLLAMNHEYVDNGLLFTDGTANWSAEKTLKGQNAMGVSVVEVVRGSAGWQVVRPSPYAKRITANTPMHITGAARGHALMCTAANPKGDTVLGTMQNCANGQTPWGTYLTCEENWSDIFVKPEGDITPLEQRYGIGRDEQDYLWHQTDARFNASQNPNESHRFGWVVEIDPYDPNSTPRKHTALGRFKHEGAAVTVTPSGHLAVYMGDDQRFEYIYKFVSKHAYRAGKRHRAHNMRLLEEGTLYVARFDANGTGQWLPLIHGQNGLTVENGFADQGEVLVKTRMAADKVGATPMDRPEWVAADPFVSGSLYCTLTNNSDRGKDGKPAPDAANPRKNNVFGHIIHWQEHNGDGTQTTFKWDILVMAGQPESPKAEHQGNIQGDVFGSPDGLAFDPRGVLWIQTDVSTSTLNLKEYAGMGNNQMVATVLGSGEYRRFLTAPNGAEVTGIAFTSDCKTLFINIQHPGEPQKGASDPNNPTAISQWPDNRADGRPRAATVVITKDDGGIIGT